MENSTNERALNADAEQPIITVTLRMNSKGREVLHFDGAAEDLDIDFTKSDQTSLRKLFCWLLDEQVKRRAKLKLVKDPSVKNATYQKVAEDYVSDLDAEIDSIFTKETQAIKDLTGTVEIFPDNGNKDKDA